MSGDDAAFRLIAQLVGVCIFMLIYGSNLVAQKKYLDFDEAALETWEEAPAGCLILWKPGIFATDGSSRRLRSSTSSSNSNSNVRYKVKLKVMVNANSTDYDTWFATAYKWPSWTNKGPDWSSSGQPDSARTFSLKSLASRWRDKFDKNKVYRCFYNPKDTSMVAMKNIGGRDFLTSYKWGVALLVVSFCPCYLFILVGCWVWLLSPCIEDAQDRAHSASRPAPNTAAHQINRHVNTLQRTTSMKATKISRMISRSGSQETREQSDEDKLIHNLLEKLRIEMRADGVYTQYQALKSGYQQISAKELAGDDRINNIKVLIPVNNAIKINIGEAKFRSHCRDLFSDIMGIILEKTKEANAKDSGVELSATAPDEVEVV